MNSFIKQLMDNHDISQKQLSNILGISSAAISQWKSTENISADILFSLSKLFNISVDELLNERLNDETLEERLFRLYNVDEINIDKAYDLEDVKIVTEYTAKIKNATTVIYELLYKKIKGVISSEEEQELECVENYFEVNLFKSPAFADCTSFAVSRQYRDKVIGERLIEVFGVGDKKSIIWELKKIYRCNKVINIEDDADWVTDEIKDNICDSYSDIEKDKIATDCFKNGDLNTAYEWIANGANILYTEQSLPCTNYSLEELNRFEGEKISLKHLDKAKEVHDKICGYVYQAYYSDYVKLIDRNAMKRVKAYAKYEKKNPAKLWEYIKGELY